MTKASKAILGILDQMTKSQQSPRLPAGISLRDHFWNLGPLPMNWDRFDRVVWRVKSQALPSQPQKSLGFMDVFGQTHQMSLQDMMCHEADKLYVQFQGPKNYGSQWPNVLNSQSVFAYIVGGS